jgi:type IV secretion system protein TrbL
LDAALGVERFAGRGLAAGFASAGSDDDRSELAASGTAVSAVDAGSGVSTVTAGAGFGAAAPDRDDVARVARGARGFGVRVAGAFEGADSVARAASAAAGTEPVSPPDSGAGRAAPSGLAPTARPRTADTPVPVPPGVSSS